MTELMARPSRADDDSSVAGRYRLGELLGRGRVSTVHAALDERLRRRVAVRLFDGDVATDTLEAAAISWTPGMSRVLDAGTDHDADGRERAYLVRDLVGGVSLAQFATMVECRPATTAALGSSVAATLAALHLRGTGHGAVHARNIFLPDFALSRDWSSDAERGTVLTDCALDGRRPDAIDPAEDIRALGTTLLGALTRRRVVGSRTSRSSLAWLRRHGGGLASRDRGAWVETLAAMTQIDAAARPSAVEAAAALATLRDGPLSRL